MKQKPPAASTLHQKILGDIEGRIVSGEWPPGHRLPFEVELAKSYDVSRMTVNKVLTKLAGAGLIERRKKSGSFVAQPRVQSAILEIHDIEAEVTSLKRAYRYGLMTRALRKADAADLATFGLDRKATLLDITSLHHAGDTPFCIEERLINLDVVPQAREADFSDTPPGQWLRIEVPWNTAEHKIYAIAADARVAGLLGISEGSPCLVVQRRTWSEQGAVTFARFTYPAEKHAIVAHFTPATQARSAP